MDKRLGCESSRIMRRLKSIKKTIMTEITINPAKQTLSVLVKSQSMHVYAISITVFDSDKEKIEHYTGKIDVNGEFTIAFTLKTSEAKGKYINFLFTIVSPDGKDSQYSAVISILEDNKAIQPELEISGCTLYGESTNVARFHLK